MNNPPQTVDEWVNYIGKWSQEKGWAFGLSDTPEKIALMHEELSEALGEYRRRSPMLYWSESEEVEGAKKPEGIPIELIDCVIRIFHYLATFNYSAQELLEMKMDYNQKRPYRHGNRRA